MDEEKENPLCASLEEGAGLRAPPHGYEREESDDAQKVPERPV